MKALWASGLLAANLLLDVSVPNGLKLRLAPVFGLVFVVVLGRVLRRPD